MANFQAEASEKAMQPRPRPHSEMKSPILKPMPYLYASMLLF